MTKLQNDLSFRYLLLTKSLECAEQSTGGVRDMMLGQAARLEQEIIVLKSKIAEEAPAAQVSPDPSIPTLNITIEMGSKSKPVKRVLPRSRTKKNSKPLAKKKKTASRKRV